MNTIVSYLMAFALQLTAVILPHQADTASKSIPCKYEETNVLPENFLTLNEQELEENIKFE